MGKILAAEWDDRELRMVSVTTTGKSFVVDHVFATPFRSPLLSDKPGESAGNASIAPSDSEVSTALRRLATRANASNSSVFLNIPRSKVELRNFNLPQAADEDLPDMVRFAAMRQFANLGDTWPIDFLVLPKSLSISSQNSDQSSNGGKSLATIDNSIEVLATSVAPSLVTSMRRICTDAGLELVHLGLRPVSTACLTIAPSKQLVAPQETVLVIDIAPDEAELVVMEGHQVVFIRTVRLAASADGSLPKLSAAEVKRTLIAAMNSRAGISVKRIILWGSNAEMNSMVSEWSGAVSLPIECIDPFSIIPHQSTSDTKLEGSVARFAPLLGLLLQREIGTQPIQVLGLTIREAIPQITPWSSLTINFLAPRQRKIPPKPIRTYALGTAAAGLLLIGGVSWYRSSHASLDNEVSDLKMQLASQDATLKLAQKNSIDWQKVSGFLETDIHWLDQIEYLSSQALPAEQMLMGDTVFSIDPASNRGIIETRVALTSPELEPTLEGRLRDSNHQVGAKGVNKSSDTNTIYPWIVEPELFVSPNKNVDPTNWKPGMTTSPKAEKTSPVTETTLEVAN